VVKDAKRVVEKADYFTQSLTSGAPQQGVLTLLPIPQLHPLTGETPSNVAQFPLIVVPHDLDYLTGIALNPSTENTKPRNPLSAWWSVKPSTWDFILGRIRGELGLTQAQNEPHERWLFGKSQRDLLRTLTMPQNDAEAELATAYVRQRQAKQTLNDTLRLAVPNPELDKRLFDSALLKTSPEVIDIYGEAGHERWKEEGSSPWRTQGLLGDLRSAYGAINALIKNHRFTLPPGGNRPEGDGDVLARRAPAPKFL
jgi:hypothetical protein